MFSDRAYVYDNSVNGEEPQLLFRTYNGKIIKIYHVVHEWAQTIIDALPHHTE
jgi:hypothetical protein